MKRLEKLLNEFHDKNINTVFVGDYIDYYIHPTGSKSISSKLNVGKVLKIDKDYFYLIDYFGDKIKISKDLFSANWGNKRYSW